MSRDLIVDAQEMENSISGFQIFFNITNIHMCVKLKKKEIF